MAIRKSHYNCYNHLLTEMILLSGQVDRQGDSTAALYVIWSPFFTLAKKSATSSPWITEVYKRFSDEDWYMQKEQQHIEQILHWSKIEEQYRLSDNLDQLGTHWKELLLEQSEKWTRKMIDWIEQYRQELLPVANTVIEKYEDKGCHDQRKAYYQEYRAMLLRLQRKLESLAEFFQMHDTMK